MTIIELTDSLRQGNPIVQAIFDNNLKTELKRLGETQNGWKFFCYLLEKGYTGTNIASKKNISYSPDNILALCQKLGIKTDTELYAWIEANDKIQTDNLLDCLDPSLELTTLKPIEHRELLHFIIQECPFEYNYQLSERFDMDYQIFHESEIQKILSTCPIDNFKYIAESRDCDDFAMMTRSWLAMKGYGNLSIPYVTINCYQNNKIEFAHGINLMIYYTDNSPMNAVFLEPQKDKMWPVDEQMPWGLSKKYDIKIRYLLM
jgi:hypothetical protein